MLGPDTEKTYSKGMDPFFRGKPKAVGSHSYPWCCLVSVKGAETFSKTVAEDGLRVRETSIA